MAWLKEIDALEDSVESERSQVLDLNPHQLEETHSHSSPVEGYKSKLRSRSYAVESILLNRGSGSLIT